MLVDMYSWMLDNLYSGPVVICMLVWLFASIWLCNKLHNIEDAKDLDYSVEDRSLTVKEELAIVNLLLAAVLTAWYVFVYLVYIVINFITKL